MAVLQLSTTIRDAKANLVESTIGAAPVLTIYKGSTPANCAAADAGTALVAITLPSDWLGASSAGVKTIANWPWAGVATDTGTATHWRIKAGATCHMQGDVTATGGGGSLTVTSTSVTFVGQGVTVTGFTYTEGNA